MSAEWKEGQGWKRVGEREVKVERLAACVTQKEKGKVGAGQEQAVSH